MLETIKKMLGKKIEKRGTLKVQGEAQNDVKIRIEADNVEFESLERYKIPISEITELKELDDGFSFIYGNRKFVFSCQDSTEIIKKLIPTATEKSIFSSESILYYTYDPETRRFEPHTASSTLQIFQDGKYHLRVLDPLSVIHCEEISTGTQYYMDRSTHSFVWSIYVDGKFCTFCVEFKDPLVFLEFSSKYIECCYKSVNEGTEFKYFENMAVMNSMKNTEETTIPEDKEDDWMEFESESPVETDFNKEATVNEHLVVGSDLAFVARGSSLGVFDIQKDDLKFRTHIQNALHDPLKIATHGQGQSLLVLDKDEKDKLQILDLNRGEVIEKWELNEDINDYFDSVKYNDNGTLVGLSDFSLFRIDPRTKDKIAEKNVYKTKNGFSCGIATERGDVAVASKKGDLRLYNKINVRAKSFLPGFGEEILGIDSSKDGAMILCTCKNYILVFTATSNYAQSIGKNKPTPKRLQLKPQHLSFIKDEVKFTPAKFDQEDTLIITSTGRFVIKWKVEDVKEGRLYDYSLKALYDVIVDEKFVVKGEDIIVALPNDVKKVTEAELRRPK